MLNKPLLLQVIWFAVCGNHVHECFCMCSLFLKKVRQGTSVPMVTLLFIWPWKADQMMLTWNDCYPLLSIVVLLICLLIAIFLSRSSIFCSCHLLCCLSLSFCLTYCIHSHTFMLAYKYMLYIFINRPMHCTQQTWIGIIVCNSLLTGFRMEKKNWIIHSCS